MTYYEAEYELTIAKPRRKLYYDAKYDLTIAKPEHDLTIAKPEHELTIAKPGGRYLELKTEMTREHYRLIKKITSYGFKSYFEYEPRRDSARNTFALAIPFKDFNRIVLRNIYEKEIPDDRMSRVDTENMLVEITRRKVGLLRYMEMFTREEVWYNYDYDHDIPYPVERPSCLETSIFERFSDLFHKILRFPKGSKYKGRCVKDLIGECYSIFVLVAHAYDTQDVKDKLRVSTMGILGSGEINVEKVNKLIRKRDT